MENIALVTIKVPTYTPAGSGSVRSTSSNNNSKRSNSSSSQSAKKMLASMPAFPVNSAMGLTPLPPLEPSSKLVRSDRPPTPSDNCSLGVKFISAGTAACIADMATFPLDTAKVRLQIQGESIVAGASASSVRSATLSPSVAALAAATSSPSRIAAASSARRGLLGMVASITKNEGVRALYSGLSPGLQRQMCFASVRIGLYDFVKQGYSNMLKVDPNQKNIGVRILAGITTGGAAVLVAQPTDVVKVRMQAQGNKRGSAKRYTSSIQAYRLIAIKEGARGLWKGTIPNVSRNAIVNCTELVSYDLIKEAILSRHIMADSIPCHFVAAVGAGFFTTLFASPVDVLKTRFMNSSEGAYKGVLDCASKMYKEGGVRTFYKGAVPAFLRFGPWNVVMFVSFEQLKKQFSQDNLNNSNNVRKSLPALEIKQPNNSRFM